MVVKVEISCGVDRPRMAGTGPRVLRAGVPSARVITGLEHVNLIIRDGDPATGSNLPEPLSP